MNEETLVLGKGIKIWSIICIVLSLITAVVNCTLGFFDLAAIGVACVLAYVWLLVQKRKIAFYSIVALVLIIMVLNVVRYDVSLVSSLSGLLNPIVTFALLSKYWKQMK